MEKILIVKKPFYVMDAGDTFELSEDGKTYTSTFSEVFDNHSDNGSSTEAKYTSSYTISTEYAAKLIEDGYLEGYDPNKDDTQKPFVNIFDEIAALKVLYSGDLKKLNEIHKDDPEIIKVEHATVLQNMIRLLNHLESLKK